MLYSTDQLLAFMHMHHRGITQAIPEDTLRKVQLLKACEYNSSIFLGVLEPIIVFKKVVKYYRSVKNDDFGFDDDRFVSNGNAVIKLMLPPGALVHASLNHWCKARADMVVCESGLDSSRYFYGAERSSSFSYDSGLLKPRYSFDLTFETCASGIHFFWNYNRARRYNFT